MYTTNDLLFLEKVWKIFLMIIQYVGQSKILAASENIQIFKIQSRCESNISLNSDRI
jgi:hypothetical protein